MVKPTLNTIKMNKYIILPILFFLFSCKREASVTNYRIKELKEYDVSADTLYLIFHFNYDSQNALYKITFPQYPSDTLHINFNRYNDSIAVSYVPPYNWIETSALNPQHKVSKIYSTNVGNMDGSNLLYSISYNPSGIVDSITRPLNYDFPHDTMYLREGNFQYADGNCTSFKFDNQYEFFIWPLRKYSGTVNIQYTNLTNPGYFPFQNVIGFSDFTFLSYPLGTYRGYVPAYLSTLADKSIYFQNKQLIQSVQLISSAGTDTVNIRYAYTTLSDTETKMEIFKNNVLQYKYIVVTEAY